VNGGGILGGGIGAPGIISCGSLAPTIVHSIPVTGGPNGAPATAGSGITLLVAPPLPVLRITGSLTLSGAATIALTNGTPGAFFFLGMSAAPGFVDFGPTFLGEVLLDPWYPILPGVLSPAGDFAVTFPLSGLSSGSVHIPVYAQALVLDSSGGFWRASNASVAVVRP
jgi:hypothetical protein